MNRFIIPMNLKCELCNNIAVYNCKAMNKKICRFCCDKYQLSNNQSDKCLKCDYLFRDVGYEVKFKIGMMISHEYKDNFVFDNEDKSLLKKTVVLYERLGIDTIDGMFNLAIQYSYVNRCQEALDLYNKILKKKTSNDDKIQIYEKMGDALVQVKKISEAKDAYVRSLDHGNIRPNIYRKLGEIYNILEEYSQSVYYHEKALNKYLSDEWRNTHNWFENDDFLYFTNYYSLAMGYSELNKPDKVIENAKSFLNYYGDFENIKERYFMKGNINGDCFMPESISAMYKLISLTYIKLKSFPQAKDNIIKARTLSKKDVELAKLEGFIEGKIDNYEMNLEVEQLRQQLVKKDRAIMILIQNSKDKSIINIINKGEVYMGSKYHIDNNGTIKNQVFGDNVTFNNNDIPLKEIDMILSEIREKIPIIGDENTQKHLDNINESIKNKKFLGLKNQLSDLLVGVTAGCIANNMPNILTRISEVVSKLH